MKNPDHPSSPLPTGLVYDDIYLRHLTGPGHPEQPARLTAILDRLRSSGLLPKLHPIPPKSAYDSVPCILAVHSQDYITRVESGCREGAACIDTLDVPVGSHSYRAAVAAVGGALAAVDAVLDRRVRNAFCAVRPPGHHALRDLAMGFCLFNNIAIAARYIQQKHNLPRVLIVDWDVHHGNGTQDAFYHDPSVLYFSVHRYPFYPGSGTASERGKGDGKGATLNVPLPVGSADKDLIDAFRFKLLPAAKAFRPDFVLISAGFDAHEDDPLGGMAVTARGYAELTRMVKTLAEEQCQGRIVSLLEGGYDLAGLADSVEQHIRVLME